MEIRSVPPPVTRIDKAPASSPRSDPADVAVDRTRDAVDEGPERRQRRDRRRHGGGKPVIERRISGDRRRRSIDITV